MLPLLTKERVGVRFKELSTLIEMLPTHHQKVLVWRFLEMKGFSVCNLKYMLTFAETYPKEEEV
jgi:hypothetical protein